MCCEGLKPGGIALGASPAKKGSGQGNPARRAAPCAALWGCCLALAAACGLGGQPAHAQARAGYRFKGTHCATCVRELACIGDSAGTDIYTRRRCVNIAYQHKAPGGAAPQNPVQKPGYTLVMQDEFEAPLEAADFSNKAGEMNTAGRWRAAHGPDWFGNTVLDWDMRQAAVSEGVLEMTLRKAPGSTTWKTTDLYSAMRLRYGYVEAKIQLPKSPGVFPSFWLWGQNDTTFGRHSVAGDINIIEQWYLLGPGLGRRARRRQLDAMAREYHFSQYWCPNPPCQATDSATEAPNAFRHYPRKVIVPMDAGARGGAHFLDLSKDYFVYGLEWAPDSIRHYLNNTLVETLPNHLNNPATLALCLYAYDPHDPKTRGKGIDVPYPTANPTTMRVDYVRVYKRDNTLERMLDFFPARYCSGTTTRIPTPLPDYFPTTDPAATVQMSVAGQPGGVCGIELRQWSSTAATGSLQHGVDWGNIGFDVMVPSCTAPGSYTLQLTVKPHALGPDDPTTLVAYKAIEVYAAGSLPKP